MLAYAPGGSLGSADVYGLGSQTSPRPDILSVMGPNQGSVANASVSLFGQSASGSAPAWALLLLVAVLVGVRVMFEFSTR